ncbi:MAG: hypothetical protein M1324_01765 [Patescibacteria group bacterium]|nr:hypothetical protein [Patescibacteria group bacterium]
MAISRLRESLVALGLPDELVGKRCHITAKDSCKRVQTFTDIQIIGCFLRDRDKFQELVIVVELQTHKGGIFDTLRRNVGPDAGGRTSWWTDVHYPKEEQSNRGIRTEGWQILGLMFK